jgi:DNA-binding transcriptional regulator GbsR (MarR family)
MKKMNPREDFIELMTENVKVHGLDDLTARIIATLFLEPKEISLEELAEKTGYCLSSMSNGIKFMETIGFIKKFKKPPSKKVYLKMENDMSELLLNMLKKKHENVFERSKTMLPEIIKKYKSTKSSKDELRIIEHYYNDILLSENIIKELISKMEKSRK